jgi:hypothetical protein
MPDLTVGPASSKNGGQPLTKRVRRRIAGSAPRRRDDTRGEVSFVQEQMLRSDQTAAGTAGNCAFAVRLRGPLDRQALTRSLWALQMRHEILRTVYRPNGPTPTQSVLPGPSPVHYEDLTASVVPAAPADAAGTIAGAGAGSTARAIAGAAGTADPSALAREIVAETARRPYALDRDPPVRWAILKMAADEHVLLMCFHHIAMDCWSESILWRELAALYAAFRAGRPDPLPPPPVQYSDFAAWQREQSDDGAAERTVEFWRENLAGAPAAVDLPFDRPATPGAGYATGTREHRLGGELAGRVAELVGRERVTEFMVLLAAFAATLGTCSGQREIVIGTQVAGRGVPEVEELIGCFANTLALRIPLSGDPSFLQLTRRVRRTVLQSVPHQHLPFPRVVDEVRPAAVPGRPRLIQVMFQPREFPARTLELAGLEAAREQVLPLTPALDLAIALNPADPDLRGVWSYRRELFEQTTIERLQRHYRHVLAHLLAAPQAPIGSVPPLAGVHERRPR